MTDLQQDDNPFASPELGDPAEADGDGRELAAFRTRKRRLLAGIILLFAISGVLTGLVPEGDDAIRIADFAVGLTFCVLAMLWCDADREEYDVERWRFFTPMMILCPGPLLLVPIYLLSTRGLAGLVSVLLAAMFLASAIAVAIVCAGVTMFATGNF